MGQEEHLIGLIRAENKKGPDGEPHWNIGFSEEDEWILHIFAESAVVAIESTQLFQEAKAAHTRLRASFQASSMLLSSQSPRDVLQDMVEQACQAADADRARMLLYDEKGQAQVIAGARLKQFRHGVYPVRDDGISSQVMRDGTPKFINDTTTQRSQVNPILLDEGTAAFCCVPLELRKKRVGVMSFYYNQPRDFPDYELDALQLYANQAAAAYDAAQRFSTSEALRHATEALVGVETLAEMWRQITVSARKVLQADVAVIWPYDYEQGQFLAAGLCMDGVPDEVGTTIQQQHVRWQPIAEEVLAKRWVGRAQQTEVCPVTRLDNALWHLIDLAGMQSFQGFLLTTGNEKLGILWVLHRQAHHFNETGQEIARTFVNHAALALKQVQLFEQVRKGKQAAEVVTRVTALGGSDISLEAIAQGTKEAVGCDVVMLYVYDRVAHGLESVPADNPLPLVCVTSQDSEGAGQRSKVVPGPLLSAWLTYDVTHIIPNATEGAPDELRQTKTIVIPLRVTGQRLGVMILEYRTPHRFAPLNTSDLERFAQQAAVAIHNARLYEHAGKQTVALQALYASGQAVMGSLEEKAILHQIAEQTWELMRVQGSPEVITNTWLKDGMKARLVAGYPREASVEIQAMLDGEVSLQPENGGKQGIVGRAMCTGQVQRVVQGLKDDPDYLQCHDNVRSELAVPIKVGGEVIGVINIEDSQEYAFDADNERIMELLASQASIAIQHARQYEELKRTKGMVGARTAVAWMGMASATWHHMIRNYADSIRTHVYMLREELKGEASVEILAAQLRDIDTIVANILDVSITAPLSTEEGVGPISLNEIVEERLKRLWGREPYASVRAHLVLTKETNCTVRANSEWFIRALDILIDNAVDAMATCAKRELRVTTRAVHGRIEVIISDTGQGIPSEIEQQILREPIKKSPGVKGSGMGLLLAQTIVQTYGGDIRLGSTGLDGTTMVLWLPSEEAPPTVRIEPGAKSALLISDRQERAWSSVLQEALSFLASLTVIPEDQAITHLAQKAYDMILIDETALQDVPALITRIRRRQPEARIVVGAALPDWKMARDVLQAGALDYLNKSKSAPELRLSFIKILEGSLSHLTVR